MLATWWLLICKTLLMRFLPENASSIHLLRIFSQFLLALATTSDVEIDYFVFVLLDILEQVVVDYSPAPVGPDAEGFLVLVEGDDARLAVPLLIPAPAQGLEVLHLVAAIVVTEAVGAMTGSEGLLGGCPATWESEALAEQGTVGLLRRLCGLEGAGADRNSVEVQLLLAAQRRVLRRRSGDAARAGALASSANTGQRHAVLRGLRDAGRLGRPAERAQALDAVRVLPESGLRGTLAQVSV